MKRKSGVSMLMLIITIVVVIVLMTTITLKINIASGRENLSVFANNMSTIEEYIASCKVLNEELPFDGILEKSAVLDLVDNVDEADFIAELGENGDEFTTEFYKVDLSKAEIKKMFTGYGKKGENDIYIYSEKTGIVYYLLGVPYEDRVYFSMNKVYKLQEQNKENND